VPGGAGAPGLVGAVIAPEEVARRVVRGIERGSFYIFTHPEQREILRRRARRQDDVFEKDFEGTEPEARPSGDSATPGG
jgi:hypothetical protein